MSLLHTQRHNRVYGFFPYLYLLNFLSFVSKNHGFSSTRGGSATRMLSPDRAVVVFFLSGLAALCERSLLPAVVYQVHEQLVAFLVLLTTEPMALCGRS